MTDQPWFHSSVSREETLQLLEKFGPQLADGAFLVRLRQGQPTRSDAEFSLSFWYGLNCLFAIKNLCYYFLQWGLELA